jgi:hypothetical protein
MSNKCERGRNRLARGRNQRLFVERADESGAVLLLPNANEPTRTRLRKALRERLSAIAEPYLNDKDALQHKSAKSICRYLPELFTFVEHPNVASSNNAGTGDKARSDIEEDKRRHAVSKRQPNKDQTDERLCHMETPGQGFHCGLRRHDSCGKHAARNLPSVSHTIRSEHLRAVTRLDFR